MMIKRKKKLTNKCIKPNKKNLWREFTSSFHSGGDNDKEENDSWGREQRDDLYIH